MPSSPIPANVPFESDKTENPHSPLVLLEQTNETLQTTEVKLKGRALALKKRHPDSVFKSAALAEDDVARKRHKTEQNTTDREETNLSTTKNRILSIPELSSESEEVIAPRVSIFDKEDELDDILDMNEALALLTKKKVVDPLLGTEIEQGALESTLNYGVMTESTTVLTESIEKPGAEEIEVLYDSDGNKIDQEGFMTEESEDVIDFNFLIKKKFKLLLG